MRRLAGYTFILALVFPALALAQYEFGGLGGFAVPSFGLSVTNASASASTGFAQGGVAGFTAGTNSTRRLGGETRYLIQYSSMKLSQGGTDVRFAARAHILHYDLLIHS